MTRDAKRQRDRHAACVRRYRDRVMREVLAGERPYNSIPKVNRKRKAKLFERNFGDKADWVREQPCEVTGADPLGWKIEAAHVVHARGMGGCHGSKLDLVPLVWFVHRAFDEWSEYDFAKHYGRTKQSIRDRAPHYEAEWQAYRQEQAA